MRKFPLTLAVLISAMGCTTTPFFESVPESQEATAIKVVHRTPEHRLTFFSYEKNATCTGLRKIAFLAERWNGIQTRLPPRKFQTFTYQYLSVGGGLSSVSCGGTYTISTSEKGTYTVNLDKADTGCYMQVVRTNELGSEPVRLIQRQQKQPFFSNDGPWCETDKQFEE